LWAGSLFCRVSDVGSFLTTGSSLSAAKELERAIAEWVDHYNHKLKMMELLPVAEWLILGNIDVTLNYFRPRVHRFDRRP
jgi:hypothetical protein